jgi:Xaa-Pro aminopeptidase
MSSHPTLAEPAVRTILEQDYPRFSDAEYDRRRGLLAAIMERHGCDHLLITGEQRSGGGVQWLTGWPVTTEAFVIFKPGSPERMYMEWFNHLPLATVIAKQTEVRWGEHRGIDLLIADLKARGARRVAYMGPMSAPKFRKLDSQFTLIDASRAYARLRLLKSDEEIEWMRIGAAFSDLGQQALHDELRIGMTERELGNLVERAWVGLGGYTSIHYMGVTPMANPNLCVPRQHASPRKVRVGDVLFTELSSHFWDYPGQVLRSYTLAADPTPLYRDLYQAAEAAFKAVCAVLKPGCTMQAIVDAADVVERAGFTICDDLVHGYGGGYLQPILGSKSRPAGPLPDMVLAENMTIVVQPNVITKDQKAGVQHGELVRVTRDGCVSMHVRPHGLLRIGD